MKVAETMPPPENNRSIRVCHAAMGDLWAGAEVHLANLVHDLLKRPKLEISVVLFNEGRLAHELRLLGVPVAVFPERQWNARTLLKKLFAYCRHHQFHILHTHKYKDNILGTVAAWRASIPYIVRTVHGLPEPFEGLQACRIRAYQVVDRFALKRRASRMIAVSADMERTLRKTYGPDKVVKIYNGINFQQRDEIVEREATRQSLGIGPDHYVIGTVGRLMPVKGHEYFVICAEQLLKTRKNLRFLIVGDGPLLDELREMACRVRIDKAVQFLGHREDCGNLIRAMDIFVLPSLHEGIPMVILEAMALARPIVATRVGGIPEVVREGVDGLLVPPQDPVALANACTRLLNERALAERCGEAAQFRVRQNFSAESMGSKTYGLYRELLGQHSKLLDSTEPLPEQPQASMVITQW